ncbi:MAG: hypothetical protein KAJ18_05140 [Candidatus Omnitrophica bacterium]|nr:hypothetical protein [Candidatus Omnitrophota bacterium]
MCYAIPVVGAVITSVVWKKTKDVKIWWLNIMFYGGAVFGIVDHLWNGELFVVPENLAHDLWLGCFISLAVIVCWLGLVRMSQKNPVLASYVRVDSKR